MLSVLQLDASAFRMYTDDFMSLFFSVIGTDRMTVEHKLVSALLADPLKHPLFDGIEVGNIGQEELFNLREDILEGEWGVDLLTLGVFSNMAGALASRTIQKPFVYRCINNLVSGLERCLEVSLFSTLLI